MLVLLLDTFVLLIMWDGVHSARPFELIRSFCASHPKTITLLSLSCCYFHGKLNMEHLFSWQKSPKRGAQGLSCMWYLYNYLAWQLHETGNLHANFNYTDICFQAASLSKVVVMSINRYNLTWKIPSLFEFCDPLMCVWVLWVETARRMDNATLNQQMIERYEQTLVILTWKMFLKINLTIFIPFLLLPYFYMIYLNRSWSTWSYMKLGLGCILGAVKVQNFLDMLCTSEFL